MAIPTTAEATAIIERAMGGRVVHIERQLRWRPTWFADVEADGEVVGKPWFNVKLFPTATFVSSAIRPLGGDRFRPPASAE